MTIKLEYLDHLYAEAGRLQRQVDDLSKDRPIDGEDPCAGKVEQLEADQKKEQLARARMNIKAYVAAHGGES